MLSVATSATSILRRRAFYAQMVCEYTAWLGQTAYALDALESADAGRLFDAFWVERCPSLESIRHEPRFKVVRERVLARAVEVRRALGVE